MIEVLSGKCLHKWCYTTSDIEYALLSTDSSMLDWFKIRSRWFYAMYLFACGFSPPTKHLINVFLNQRLSYVVNFFVLQLLLSLSSIYDMNHWNRLSSLRTNNWNIIPIHRCFRKIDGFQPYQFNWIKKKKFFFSLVDSMEGKQSTYDTMTKKNPVHSCAKGKSICIAKNILPQRDFVKYLTWTTDFLTENVNNVQLQCIF